jgi:hypothetical protein
MVGFGHKQAWLAVRDGAVGPIEVALDLRDLGPVSWRVGVDLAYLTDDRLLVTPLLPGAGGSQWRLITGRALLRPDWSVDIAALSATLDTEVQFFATHRVAESHHWERAVNGALIREFEYVGEIGKVVAWRGAPDEAERDAGLPATLDDEADVLVSEHDVMHVAGAWSVDPTSLEGQPASGPLRAAAVTP